MDDTARTLRSVDLLTRLASEPTRAALFLDVDGVLAPIATRPDDARVPGETRSTLARLLLRYGLVACVTGRDTETARRIVGVEGLRFAGEHGLELEPEALAWVEPIHALAAGSGWPWTETKPLSAAFHFRQAPNPEAARAQLEPLRLAALEQGFRTRWGRMVLEVLPPVEATKGTAVVRLLAESGLRRALYAGDDTTDLDGFTALDGLELAVRVAVSSPEAPTELGRRADLVVGSPAAFLELLRLL